MSRKASGAAGIEVEARGTALIAELDEARAQQAATSDNVALYESPDRPRPLVGDRTLPSTVIRENRQIHLFDLDNMPPEFADWPEPPVLCAVGTKFTVRLPRKDGVRLGGERITGREA